MRYSGLQCGQQSSRGSAEALTPLRRIGKLGDIVRVAVFLASDASRYMTGQGWMRTGDIAWVDAHGYLYIVDRKKDMILRGGENVYCAEVEAALLAHSKVAEACAFAIEDERLGEEVGAAVLFRSDANVTAEELRHHVGLLLARYKVPRHIWISETPLPRNASSKLLGRQLKESLLSETTQSSREGRP